MWVKRSTLDWRLTSKKFHLSSSRHERVKAAEHSLQCDEQSISMYHVVKQEEVSLGDWCLFKNSPEHDHFFVGRIFGFSYFTSRGQGRVYSKSTAPVSTPEGVSPRKIGSMGKW